ncbi:MAG: hypothetical protein CME06_17745 [Gemmatimonadetes bacterium]|nr:hypothetical protein [Gemmatimonadota bacterium]
MPPSVQCLLAALASATAVLAASSPRPSASLIYVGASRVDLTRTDWEAYDDANGNGHFDRLAGETWFDTGHDRLYDFEEEGAFGVDGAPGRVGVDDDQNGSTDDCDRSPHPIMRPRERCKEYGAPGSDDMDDPARDNWHWLLRPFANEGNLHFDNFGLAGFGPNWPVGYFRAVNEINDDDINGDGINDGIWARSIAIENEQGIATLIMSVDFAAMMHDFINPVKRRISEHAVDLGIDLPYENIVISSTHNHNSPDALGLWDLPRGGLDQRYIHGAGQRIDLDDTGVLDRMLLSAVEALAGMKPSLVRSAQGRPIACYDPETNLLLRDEDCVLYNNYGQNINPEPGYHRFVVQNDLREPWVRNMAITVLQFAELAPNGEVGETIATLVNFANHPEVLGSAEGNIQSSDYPHYVRERLEGALGGISVFVSGTVGNQIGYLHSSTPVPLYDAAGNLVCQIDPENPQDCLYDANGRIVPEWTWSESREKVRSLGLYIGDVAIEAIEASSSWLESPPLEILHDTVEIELENPFLGFFGCTKLDDFRESDEPYWIPGWCEPLTVPGCIARVAAHDPCAIYFTLDLNIVRIGDAQFITSPGEMPPEYLLGRDATTVSYRNPPRNDICDFPAMPGLIDLMEAPHRFVANMGNSEAGYLVPYADYVPLGDMSHPNYYEEEVSSGPHFGDDVANALAALLGDYSRPYGAEERACFTE